MQLVKEETLVDHAMNISAVRDAIILREELSDEVRKYLVTQLELLRKLILEKRTPDPKTIAR